MGAVETCSPHSQTHGEPILSSLGNQPVIAQDTKSLDGEPRLQQERVFVILRQPSPTSCISVNAPQSVCARQWSQICHLTRQLCPSSQSTLGAHPMLSSESEGTLFHTCKGEFRHLRGWCAISKGRGRYRPCAVFRGGGHWAPLPSHDDRSSFCQIVLLARSSHFCFLTIQWIHPSVRFPQHLPLLTTTTI